MDQKQTNLPEDLGFLKHYFPVRPLQNTRFREMNGYKASEYKTLVPKQDWVYVDHPYKRLVFLWAIRLWRAASFWLLLSSCKFLWVLALGEAVKSLSLLVLSTSLMVSQICTTFPWKDSWAIFVCTFWCLWQRFTALTTKTTPRVMFTFQGNANFFLIPLPTTVERSCICSTISGEPRHFFSRLNSPNSFKLPI